MTCQLCEKPAEFEIHDHNERRPDVGGGVACVDCLGQMIGSVPPTPPTGPWTVVALTKEGQ